MNHIGDYILPIIIIGSIIIQWLGSRKKNSEPDRTNSTPNPQTWPRTDTPPRTSPRTAPGTPGRPSPPVEPGWDDLMEALGQPSTTPPPTPPRPEPTHRPSTYQPPEVPRQLTLLEQQRALLIEKKRELEKIKKQSNIKKSTHLPTQFRHHSTSSPQLRHLLENRHTLKQAIILTEIFQAPVSMR